MQHNYKTEVLRLGRVMCGKAFPFRSACDFFDEAMPHQVREAKLKISNSSNTERQSLSAHRAAQPHSFVPGSSVLTEVIKRV
jgi:hypothetical protein